jgi:hypothetical protein
LSGDLSGGLTVAAAGIGGVDELRTHIKDDTVSWALLRFEIGSGAFRRMKLIAVHCNGEHTPAVLRGRLNSISTVVLQELGATHATVEVNRAAELTIEWLCLRLLPLLCADDGEFSLSRLVQAYSASLPSATITNLDQNAMIAISNAPIEGDTVLSDDDAMLEHSSGASGTAHHTSSRACVGGITASIIRQRLLHELANAHGMIDWLLLEASNLCVRASGCGGLEELKRNLVPDSVLFGVVRFTFGQGSGASGIQVVKHVFVHWAGADTPAVQRGRLNAHAGDARAEVQHICSVALSKMTQCLDEIALVDIVAELKRLATVDQQCPTRDRSTFKDIISVEAYLAGVADAKASRVVREQELKQARRSECDVAAPGMGDRSHVVEKAGAPSGMTDVVVKEPLRTAAEIVGAVSSLAGAWNWALFHGTPASQNDSPSGMSRTSRSASVSSFGMEERQEKVLSIAADVVPKYVYGNRWSHGGA